MASATCINALRQTTKSTASKTNVSKYTTCGITKPSLSKSSAPSFSTQLAHRGFQSKSAHQISRRHESPRISQNISASADAAVPAETPPPAKPAKKPRLPALDSVRFFLIAYIATGHFVACATKDVTILTFFTQINVVVGAFFVLSGYVAGYVATELGKYEASPRIKPAHKYIIGRIFGYYPLYFFVQLLFGAMFVYADNLYNGPIATMWHAFLTFTLSQAWFPAHAELWNAPTWFLSALTFAMVVVPFALPTIATWTKRNLKLAFGVLTGLSLVAKLAYSYDLGVWTILEGMTLPKLHPNLMFWNITRFHPFYALLEVLMGVVACRLVMLDGVDGDTEDKKPPASAAVVALGMVGVLVARTFSWLSLNDPLTRVLIFLPLFTIFLMRVHRQTVYNGGKGFAGLMAAKPLVYLGNISFPIYIIHGPLGQLFYKKAVATKVFGFVFTKYPWFFGCYALITLVCAMALHHGFVMNPTVQTWTKSVMDKVAKKLE